MGWQAKRIAELGEVVTGTTPSTRFEEYYGGSYSLISPSDLDNGKYVRTAHRKLTEAGFSKCRALPKDTVLVGCIGNIGKLGMVGDDCSATNQQINALICKADHDPHFVYYSLHANVDRLREAAVMTTVPLLNKSNFSNVRIEVPELEEQKGIAEVLSTVQKAIAQQERLILTTTELKQALMQKLFTEGLRGEKLKETEIGPVPESWEALTLGELGRVVTGTTPSTQVLEYYTPAKADFIAPADIGNKRQVKDSEKKISMTGYAVSRPLPPDSVMCVCIGATIGKVGMSYKPFSATNQQINSIICNENNDPRFIYYFILHHAAYWRGFATFGTMPMLSKGAFEKVKIYVPKERVVQSEIADVLEAIDNKIDVNTAKREQLQDLFRTLLHELMTGKVRVNDTNKPWQTREN